MLEIWLNVVFGVWHTIHTSTPIFSTETETKEKGKLKLQHLYQLRWLPRVLLRLNSARYHCLSNVSINRVFKNDASNPKQKRNHFSTWKAWNHFGIKSNSFKLGSKMCLSLGPKKWQKSSINNRLKSSYLLLFSRTRYVASHERAPKWIPTRDATRVFPIFVTSRKKMNAKFLAFLSVIFF